MPDHGVRGYSCDCAGQVGFKDFKAVMKTKVEERVNAIVNRLNATKRDVPQPDLAGEKEAYEEEVEDLSGHPLHPKSRELKYLEQSQTLIC